MINDKLDKTCRKILTYGMCLDMVSRVTADTKTQQVPVTPKTANRTYNTFINSIKQKGV